MDDDEEVLCRFGTPLEPLEEDEIPSKKPISIEDQIVTDSNGRRRFHGAFTGGFSAGFWNTVGSLEGWKPQDFKSSRSEKASQFQQKVTDFMDEEDLGEFGIAPQRVQTTDDFTPQDSKQASSRKRKLKQSVSGPIPGDPVLHQLLRPARDGVAIRLLKKMGWKVGQGIGARQTRKEKKAAREQNARERYVMKKYGCDMGPLQKGESLARSDASDSDEDFSMSDDENITFAPDDFEPYVCSVKDNKFGLGYSGLDRNPVLKKQQHINLFTPFEMLGKDNKKLSIRGQAFGVGALEEEDEDIYAVEDMTRYDFSLEEKKGSQLKKNEKKSHDYSIVEGFHAGKENESYRKKTYTINFSAGFKPRNWGHRKTRFEPLDEAKVLALKSEDEYKTKGLGRHDLNPEERGIVLGEKEPKKPENEKGENRKSSASIENLRKEHQKRNQRTQELLNAIDSRINFSQGGVVDMNLEQEVILDKSAKQENDAIQEEARKVTKSLGDTKPTIFKPFLTNPEKQERYEKFIEKSITEDEEITKFLTSIQPLSMSDWDREMEKKEFLQASKIYKPLKGLMSDRFVSEATIIVEKTNPEVTLEQKKVEIKRTKITWRPSSQLCKRFNVAEPFGGTMEEDKRPKKPRFSVFDYLEASVNTKNDFVTPVIIPKKVEKPTAIVPMNSSEQENVEKSAIASTSRCSAKDIFLQDDITSSQNINSTHFDDKKSTEKSVPKTERVKTNSRPKTELEKKVEESRDKHPSEKKDLFKAIFEDSTDDETEESNENNQNTNTVTAEPSSSVEKIESSAILKSTTKPVAEANILRNTSPPRGIFAYLFNKTNKEDSSLKDNENLKGKSVADETLQHSSKDEKASPVEDDGIYGPKLPTVTKTLLSSNSGVINVEEQNSSSKKHELNSKLIKKSKGKEIIEQWVEKSNTEENNHRKKKKKKEKVKDKKKKSKKHKKDKKKHHK